MARHRTRREAMTIKKQHATFDGSPTTRGRDKAILGSVIGISICATVVIYFAYSAPNVDTFVQKRESDGGWHQVKHKWSLEHLEDTEFATVTNAVNIERLKKELEEHLLVVRIPGSEGNIKVKNFISNTMRDLDWDVEEDSFLESPPKSYSPNKIRFTNVIATFNPDAKRKLVLACHYDSKIVPTGFLAATDSAVPCAMLLEIAKVLNEYLKQMQKDSDLTLQLIFLDGEEAIVDWTKTDSIYGARHLAQKWHKQDFPSNSNGATNVLDSIDLFVLLDLLGEKNPNFYQMQQVRTRHFDEIIRIEKKLDDKKYYFRPGVINSAVEDDHIPFLQKNVPILHIIPIPFPKNWHKITDDGKNLDYDTIHRLTKIFAVFVSEYLHLKPHGF